MNTQLFVQRLEAEQASLAKAALGRPADRDAFEYGRVVGLYAGLEQAKQVVLNLNAELEEKGRDL